MTPRERLGSQAGQVKFEERYFVRFLIPSAPVIADLPESFKADVLRMIDASGPIRREVVEISEKDTCKLGFGYAC